MIRQISVEHFKSISSANQELSKINVLVGSNATGKSNFIDVFRFLKDALQFDLDRAVSERHGIDSIRQWSPSRPYHIRISVSVETKTGIGEYTLVLSSSKGQYKIIREDGVFEDDDLLVADEFHENFPDVDVEDETLVQVNRRCSFTRDRSGVINIKMELFYKNSVSESYHEEKQESIDDLFLTYARHSYPDYFDAFASLRRAIIDFEVYSIFPNTLRTPQTPSNEARLSADGNNLCSIFKNMSRKSRRGQVARNEIVETMKTIIPNLENIQIQTLGGLMVPIFRVLEADGKRHDFNVSQISDGTLRVFGLLTAIYHPSRPSIIALEEPEQNVHPGIMTLICDAIKSAAKTRQVLVSTHSPEMLDEFNEENLIVVTMIDNVTKVGPVHPTQKKALKENLFSPGELMRDEGYYLEG